MHYFRSAFFCFKTSLGEKISLRKEKNRIFSMLIRSTFYLYCFPTI